MRAISLIARPFRDQILTRIDVQASRIQPTQRAKQPTGCSESQGRSMAARVEDLKRLLSHAPIESQELEKAVLLNSIQSTAGSEPIRLPIIECSQQDGSLICTRLQLEPPVRQVVKGDEVADSATGCLLQDLMLTGWGGAFHLSTSSSCDSPGWLPPYYNAQQQQ